MGYFLGSEARVMWRTNFQIGDTDPVCWGIRTPWKCLPVAIRSYPTGARQNYSGKRQLPQLIIGIVQIATLRQKLRLLIGGGKLYFVFRLSGSSSAVERQLPKLDVAGSIPVSRSISFQNTLLCRLHSIEYHPQSTLRECRRANCLNGSHKRPASASFLYQAVWINYVERL